MHSPAYRHPCRAPDSRPYEIVCKNKGGSASEAEFHAVAGRKSLLCRNASQVMPESGQLPAHEVASISMVRCAGLITYGGVSLS